MLTFFGERCTESVQNFGMYKNIWAKSGGGDTKMSGLNQGGYFEVDFWEMGKNKFQQDCKLRNARRDKQISG